MILKKITLTNVRSYKGPTTVEFAKGRSLFEGDIGSGKSTILHGVEFALFGLGDIEGLYLLRGGEKEGSVNLEFDVNGSTFTAYRTLVKRGQGVSQGEGYIIEDGEQTSYGVTEMKSRILKILNFNERIQAKTSSLVYRYAIFTPQEMMKEVIQQKPKERLETLRRAFGIEEYSTAIKNLDLLTGELRSLIKHITESTKDLILKRNELEKENQGIEYERSVLEKDLQEEKDLTTKKEDKKNEITKLQPLYERFLIIGQAIQRLQEQIEEKEREKKGVKERKAELDSELNDIGEAEKSLKELKPKHSKFTKAKERLLELEPTMEKYQDLEGEIEILKGKITNEKENLHKKIEALADEIKTEEEDLKKRKQSIADMDNVKTKIKELSQAVKKLKSLTSKIESLRGNIDSIKARIEEKNEKLEEKQQELDSIREIGVEAPCPKCKQKLTHQHFLRISGDYESELEKIRQKITDFVKEKGCLCKDLKDAKIEEEALGKKQTELDNLSQKMAGIMEKQNAILSDSKKINEKKQKLLELKQALKKGEYSLEERNQTKELLQMLKKIAYVKKEYETLRKDVASFERSKIESLYGQLESKISRRETVLNQIEKNDQKLQELVDKIQKLNEELESTQKEFEEKKNVKGKIDILNTEKEKLESDLKKKGEAIAARNEAITQLTKNVANLGLVINTMESQLRQKETFQQIQVWLGEFFAPCIRDIEQYVLASYNEEFDRLFQRWFMALLEAGDIAVSVDDVFSPTIQHHGLELDVNSLSGGEKTSVALAYRLALNVIVKKICNAMNSNLLVLDEPTDGFSHEQLNRLRDVLEDLNCEQVILVSHEKELESFVDRVYRITKENNISRVEEVSA